MSARKNKEDKASHISKGNVLDDLDFSSKTSSDVKMKSELFNEVLLTIKKKRYSSSQLKVILTQSQQSINDLLSGKLSKFSVGELQEFLECLKGEANN